MNDFDDVIVYKKSVERLRVHIFLNGLDAEFEQNVFYFVFGNLVLPENRWEQRK